MFAVIANSSLSVVETLISGGADVNSMTSSGTSVLMIALALNGNNLELIDYLLKKGANLNYSDPHKVTPLMVALKSSTNPKVIELLLKNGANPKVKDDLGISAADILKSNSKLAKNPSLLKKIN
ncbi:UNVERIFIED_CONTAM: hypothetical protein PYX00_011182 [Menopon gallinae]|uniref:Ankyrin repeat protein n=1 Tax=Menopon gallinae TaxID=328185 RepID=A0AAW2H6C9_9NEOP